MSFLRHSFFVQIEIDVESLPKTQDALYRSWTRCDQELTPAKKRVRVHAQLRSRLQVVEADQDALAKVVGETLGAVCSANEALTAENDTLKAQLETLQATILTTNKALADLHEYSKELLHTLECCGVLNL